MFEGDSAWLSRLSKIRKKALTKARQAGVSDEVRSGFELTLAILLRSLNADYEFEKESIIWTPRPIPHKYTPDFKVKTKSGKILYLETKGRFMPDDMEKHMAVREQHPDLDIRLIFSNPNTWYRAAKTRSYAKWATEKGFIWCGRNQIRRVLPQWLAE